MCDLKREYGDHSDRTVLRLSCLIGAGEHKARARVELKTRGRGRFFCISIRRQDGSIEEVK
jgi:hypothetical protein